MVFHPGKKIVLIIATLRGGGAERVMTMLAGEWIRRGNQVTLITLGDTSDDAYSLGPGVKRVALDVLAASQNKLGSIANNFRRWSRLRQAIRAEKPDVVLSFMDTTNVLTLLATRGLSLQVVVGERVDPRRHQIPRGWARLRRLLYPKAAAVAVQTSAVAGWARQIVPASKVYIIPNPVLEHPASAVAPAWLPGQPYIVAMGRLWTQKGFDLLLQAYARLHAIAGAGVVPRLVIMGEGPERQNLEARIRHLDLEEHVLLPGRVTEPAPVLSKAMFFVMSSLYEGFPNALLEAMAAGLPVVSFNCPSGPADIIKHDQNGLLVRAEDTEALARAMQRLLDDPQLRQRLGSAAATVVHRFSLAKVTDQWEDALEKAIAQEGRNS